MVDLFDLAFSFKPCLVFSHGERDLGGELFKYIYI